MNYEKFVHILLKYVEKELLPSETVEKCEVLKNNGIRAVGLAIRKKEETIAPVIYLEEYYRSFLNGATLEALAVHLLGKSRNAPSAPDWDYHDFLDFEIIKNRIVYKLVNAEKNEPLLKEVPHLAVLDLAVIFYVLIPSGEGVSCSVLIKNSHMELWRVAIPELYRCARKNMPELCPPVFCPLSDFMEKLRGERLEECPLYVLTNEEGINGASALLYPEMPKKIYEAFHCGYYLLPSSIHEFLIVPEDRDVNSLDLVEMVREVNGTQVREDELLSDHIYYFNGCNITKI